jgi:medium-chain acyl-[acyl-carrier-protein] hydrolase
VTRVRRVSEARLRLLCFPHAGADMSIIPGKMRCRPTSRCGPQTILGVVRDSERLPCARFVTWPMGIAPAMAPFLDRPLVLFGHSMGALVAFETLLRLRREHAGAPAKLLVSASKAPQMRTGNGLLHQLDVSALLGRLRTLDVRGSDALDNQRLQKALLPALRADLEACDKYTYTAESPLDCPVYAFGGAEDPEVGRADLEEWRWCTNQRFTLDVLAGGHFFFHSAAPEFFEILLGRIQ